MHRNGIQYYARNIKPHFKEKYLSSFCSETSRGNDTFHPPKLTIQNINSQDAEPLIASGGSQGGGDDGQGCDDFCSSSFSPLSTHIRVFQVPTFYHSDCVSFKVQGDYCVGTIKKAPVSPRILDHGLQANTIFMIFWRSKIAIHRKVLIDTGVK